MKSSERGSSGDETAASKKVRILKFIAGRFNAEQDNLK